MNNFLKFPARTFVKALAAADAGAGRKNPWAGADAAAQARRDRLIAHLSRMSPKVLLVASQGREVDVATTGVSLCSEHVARCGLVPGVVMAASGTSTQADIDPLSANVWRTLTVSNCPSEAICFPVIPFPSADGRGMEARRSEALRHAVFLRQFIHWYTGIKVVAVGDQADQLLTALGIAHEKMRLRGPQLVNIRHQIASFFERLEKMDIAAALL